MRSGSIESVTIQDITEAADVGHGSFYLHFKTKHDVLVPIIQQLAVEVDEKLAPLRETITDPAVIMSISGRHMGRVIVADKLWRWVLQHAPLPVDEIQNAVGQFSQRDFERAVADGRFKMNNYTALSRFALGGYVNVLLSALDLEDSAACIDQGVEVMLRCFGLSLDEADRIAHQPLPEIN